MNHYQIIRSYLPTATVGYIDIGGKRLQSLERPWLDNESSVSCIPEGTYRVCRDHTGKHQYYRVQDVTNRTLIEWHVANYVNQLEGCTGFGLTRANDNVSVNSSKDALQHILDAQGNDDFLVTYRAFNPSFDAL